MFAISVFMLQACCTPCKTYRPKWIEHPAQICVERPEEFGYMNIAEVNVIIRDFQTLRLEGGQAACVHVSAGDYFVYAQSRDPYDPNNPNPEAWKSETLRFDLKDNEKVELLVCKGSSESRFQWVLKYANQRGGDKCQTELEKEEIEKRRTFAPKVTAQSTKSNWKIIELKVDLKKERELQESVDEGHQPWRLEPISVAAVEVGTNVTGTMRVEDCRIKSEKDIDAEVECKSDKNYVVTLKKLVRPTRDGIWTALSIKVEN
jgi:hypothetical protein